jgi:hypothetical protein
VILPYCRYVADTVRLDIREGHIIRIEGGLDVKLMRDWLDDGRTGENDRDPYAVSHLGRGMNLEAVVRDCAQRRGAGAPPRRRAHIPGRLPLLHRPEHPRRRQAQHPRALRRADARLHRRARRKHGD